jgi:hypothetical protein
MASCGIVAVRLDLGVEWTWRLNVRSIKLKCSTSAEGLS